MSWFVEVLQRDGTAQHRMAVPSGGLRIGRALDNDVVLDDEHCAPYHARLESDGDAARLIDLGTRNGLVPKGGRRTDEVRIIDDRPIRLGQTLLRFRSTAWPVPAERPLDLGRIGLWATLLLAVYLCSEAWGLMVEARGQRPPLYLNSLGRSALALGLWSAVYTLYGRLISGKERFFSHLAIICIGLLALGAVETVLNTLAFCMNWLWPVRIQPYVQIAGFALIVRQHLRLADPNHWPILRWFVGLAALGIALVPLLQLYITEDRLTRVQTVTHLAHPMLRTARPVTIETFLADSADLKRQVDDSRDRNLAERGMFEPSED
jgi:pSer/pThr/pTyr-binding forkhead associated (FHA) protein